jgi:hypothetical protein
MNAAKESQAVDWIAFAAGYRMEREQGSKRGLGLSARMGCAALLGFAKAMDRIQARRRGSVSANDFAIAWLAGMVALWTIAGALLMAGRACSEAGDAWIVAPAGSAWGAQARAALAGRGDGCGPWESGAGLLSARCVGVLAPTLLDSCSPPECRVVRVGVAQAAAWVALNRFPEPMAQAGAPRANAWGDMTGASPAGIVFVSETFCLWLILALSARGPLRRSRGDAARLPILLLQAEGMFKGVALAVGVGAFFGTLFAGVGRPAAELAASSDFWRWVGGALLGAGIVPGLLCSLVWRSIASDDLRLSDEPKRARTLMELGARAGERERLRAAASAGQGASGGRAPTPRRPNRL